jgi:uncharacterized membrane protein YfcA
MPWSKQADLLGATMEPTLPSLTFPLAAFVTGALSGLFGIGGGLLLNPVLLQIGINPQVYRIPDFFFQLYCSPYLPMRH